jgi:hypothetical protein
MRTYRCFFRNERGRIGLVELIEAFSDDEATSKCVELLKSKLGYHGIELWDLDRLVHSHP